MAGSALMSGDLVSHGFIHAGIGRACGIRVVATTRQAPGCSAPPWQHSNLGLRCGDDPAVVQANRRRLVSTLALPSQPVWLQQVHGTGVLEVARPLLRARPMAAEPVADAALTRCPGAVLAVLSADCLPVVRTSRDGDALALIHAGWRGLAAGVIEATLAALAASGVAAGRLQAWLGPAIGAADYEIDAPVRAAFLAHDAAAAAAFRASRAGHWRCDLYALVRQRLGRAGVTTVAGGHWSTAADARRFHSHRRDGPASGRQATLAWIGSGAGDNPRPGT